MRSHLTPFIFRQILRNAPLTHANCSRISPYHILRSNCRVTPASRTAVRTLWGFGRKEEGGKKPVNADPGLGPLIKLKRALDAATRPPLESDIRNTLTQLLEFKANGKLQLNDVEVIHVLTAFKFLEAPNKLEDNAPGIAGLQKSTLLALLQCLSNYNYPIQETDVLELAQKAFQELESRTTEALRPDDAEHEIDILRLDCYIKILSNHGRALEARDMLKSMSDDPRIHLYRVWSRPIRAFALEKNTVEISRTIEIMQKLGMKFHRLAHEGLMNTFDEAKDFESAKIWYKHPLDGHRPTLWSSHAMLRLCIAHRAFEWGQHILDECLAQEDVAKSTWDLTLKWAAGIGKSVDEIDRMMSVMIDRGQTPDSRTINFLVEYANSINDPYTAERFIALAERRGIELDAQTYILQMEYRLGVGDLGGAQVSYNKMQSHEVQMAKDIVLLNQLIVALCKAKNPDYDTIMEYANELTERKGRFEAGTVGALCQIHLSRSELDDVIDLLQTHVSHLGLEERASVQNSFVDFIITRKNNLAAAWDAYTILQETFTDIDVDFRTRIMDEFFRRRRSDMAVHIFGHMRRSNFSNTKPTPDIYVRCLQGIAKRGDEKALITVHNMLKLDAEVELNTRLHNALMLAYMGCNDPRQSLVFWDNIVYSSEGPTYNSICIALRACELAPFGEEKAKEIWEKLKKFGIEPTEEIYAAYVGALAGSGLVEEAKKIVEEMEGELGSPPNALTIGALCNGPNRPVAAKEAQAWAKSAFPMAWKELETRGKDRTGRYRLDRQLLA